MDDETIQVYDQQAQKYVDMVSRDKPDQDLRAFIAALPMGGEVLDLGCGPGNSAAMLRDAGFTVTATDASAEMVRMARERFQIDAQQIRFEDLDATAAYEGVWANFSLLHAPRVQFPRHLAAIHRALRPGGILHLGLKTGTGEKRDSIGRLYSYFSEEELLNHLAHRDFTLISRRKGKTETLAGGLDPFIILLAKRA